MKIPNVTAHIISSVIFFVFQKNMQNSNFAET